MVGVFVAFIRVVYGRMIYMSLPTRTLVRSPFVNSHLFTSQLDPWSFSLLSLKSPLRETFSVRYEYIKTNKSHILYFSLCF